MRRARLILVLAVACTAPPKDRAVSPAATPAPIASPTSASSSPDAAIADSTQPMFAITTDRKILDDLEHRGGSFASMLESKAGPLANDALTNEPRYASMLRVFEGDVRAALASDPSSGVGMAKSHRVLDLRMLRSPHSRFELVGVTHRLDRAHAKKGSCGEARFVYRLAYSTEQRKIEIASRLPATMAVTFWLTEGAADCRAIAARARPPSGGLSAEWLASKDGPFGGIQALRARFKSVETNFQIVRWPSTTRPDLGGHAEYVLRVFEKTSSDPRALAPAPLENTPDVAKLREPQRRAELARWIRENLDGIDAGTALLPPEWLATKAVSVSPRGLARFANRPFRQLVEPSSLADLTPTLASRSFVKSPEALVRRLDQLSCNGCHQSRSVAGFHLLGEDRVAGANSIAVALSPHAASESQRRAALIERIAQGGEMPKHPPAERAPEERGGYGARCGLGDPGFAGWTCDEGLACDRADRARGEEALVGTCYPKTPDVGDACEHAIVSRDANPARDRASIERGPCSSGAVCGTNQVGFPGGMCTTSCAAAGKNGVCAGIPILTDFNACLARNEPFERCIAESTRPSGVRACDLSTPCREDYICAGAPGTRGACMPPYFLFQLRVDGHPLL